MTIFATTKSHRGNKDRELIKFEENEAHIRIHFEKQGIDHQLDMHLKKNKAKGVAIDRIPIRRSSDLLGQIPVILFSPEDLKIVKSGPSERRKFLDIEYPMLLMFLSDYSENVSVLTDYFSELVFYYNLLIDTDIIFPFGIIQYREIWLRGY